MTQNECMKFRHLRYFIAVVEEGNFSLAAQRLGIQQSPLSRAIRALERDVGVSLLERSTSGSTATPAGTKFLHHAISIIKSADSALHAARGATDGPGKFAD